MLGNRHKPLFILQIIPAAFIAKAVTQNVELSIEIDATDEQQNVKNEKINNKDFKNENKVNSDYAIKADGTNKQLHKAGVSEESNWANKLKGEKSPSFQFKDVADEEEEPGFNLSLEEMKKLKMWKDGVIPYYIDVVSFKNVAFRDKIRQYLQMVNSWTSLNFMELTKPPTDTNERWVIFMNRRGLLGCADHSVKNFTNHGVQPVVLGYDCMTTKGELAEAVMSIAGIPAQHNAPDRDKYIKVNLENIMPDKRYLFEKLSDSDWLYHDLEYDFDSVTHYDTHKYSANGRATIELKIQRDDLYPAIVLSTNDLLKIKMAYNYITRSKKLQVPVCKKLFEPNSKFDQLNSVPDKKLKYRKKPSKYTSIANGENSGEKFFKKIKENKGHNLQEKYSDDVNRQNESENRKNISHEDENRHVQENRYDEDGHNGDGNGYNEDINSEENEGTPFLNANKRKKLIDPPTFLSDYESTERTKVSLKKSTIIDPLFFLSDYETGDEHDRKKLLQHIKKKTLNYSSGKQALKFTNSGTSLHILKRPKNV